MKTTLALLLCLLLGEFTLQGFFLAQRGMKVAPASFVLNDDILGYRPVANAITLNRKYQWNASGFRGAEVPKIKGSKTRVFCVGGSTTFGTGNETNTTYPALLQNILGDRYEVVNVGVSGWGIYQHNYRLRKDLAEYKPDKLVVHTVINSLDYPHKMFKNDNRITYQLFKYSYVFKLMDLMLARTELFTFHYRIYNDRNADLSVKAHYRRLGTDGPEKYMEEVSDLILFAKRAGIELFVVVPPLRTDSKFYPKEWDAHDEMYNRIRQRISKDYDVLLSEQNVRLIDLTTLFSDTNKMDEMFYDTIHPLAPANKLIAEEISFAIRE